MKGDIPKPTKTYLLFIKILIIPRRQRLAHVRFKKNGSSQNFV